jgi:hypothetical protein
VEVEDKVNLPVPAVLAPVLQKLPILLMLVLMLMKIFQGAKGKSYHSLSWKTEALERRLLHRNRVSLFFSNPPKQNRRCVCGTHSTAGRKKQARKWTA